MRVLFLIPIFVFLTAATNINHVIEVPSKWKSCKQDSECVQVIKACSHCGSVDAISQKYSEKFDAAYEAACGKYTGPHCDFMMTPDPVMTCKKRKCVLGN